MTALTFSSILIQLKLMQSPLHTIMHSRHPNNLFLLKEIRQIPIESLLLVMVR